MKMKCLCARPPARLSVCLSVCLSISPSVRPSVCRRSASRCLRLRWHTPVCLLPFGGCDGGCPVRTSLPGLRSDAPTPRARRRTTTMTRLPVFLLLSLCFIRGRQVDPSTGTRHGMPFLTATTRRWNHRSVRGKDTTSRSHFAAPSNRHATNVRQGNCFSVAIGPAPKATQ